MNDRGSGVRVRLISIAIFSLVIFAAADVAVRWLSAPIFYKVFVRLVESVEGTVVRSIIPQAEVELTVITNGRGSRKFE